VSIFDRPSYGPLYTVDKEMIYEAVDHLHDGQHPHPYSNALNGVPGELYVMQPSGTTNMRKDVAARKVAG
jgi:hypothetical protein